jgi:hypothetical protein
MLARGAPPDQANHASKTCVRPTSEDAIAWHAMPGRGLEPLSREAEDFKSSVFTGFTTQAPVPM